MKRARLPFLPFLGLCAIVAGTPQPASADWQFTPFIGMTFGGNTTLVDSELVTSNVHRTYGGAVALLGRGPFGAEAYFAYTPRFLDDPSQLLVTRGRVFALMGNVVVTAPLKWNQYGLRPFVSGGFGLLRVSKEDKENFFPLKLNRPAFDIGGGAIGFVSDRRGLRFDLRYTSTLKNTEVPAATLGLYHLRYWTASVGLVLRR